MTHKPLKPSDSKNKPSEHLKKLKMLTSLKVVISFNRKINVFNFYKNSCNLFIDFESSKSLCVIIYYFRRLKCILSKINW